eukprot:2736064-Pyramimonas_sp.AAC.1
MSARSSEFDIAETRETATLSADALASIRTNREAQEKTQMGAGALSTLRKYVPTRIDTCPRLTCGLTHDL